MCSGFYAFWFLWVLIFMCFSLYVFCFLCAFVFICLVLYVSCCMCFGFLYVLVCFCLQYFQNTPKYHTRKFYLWYFRILSIVFTAYIQNTTNKKDSIFAGIKLHLHPWKRVKNYEQLKILIESQLCYLVACIWSTDLIRVHLLF